MKTRIIPASLLVVATCGSFLACEDDPAGDAIAFDAGAPGIDGAATRDATSTGNDAQSGSDAKSGQDAQSGNDAESLQDAQNNDVSTANDASDASDADADADATADADADGTADADADATADADAEVDSGTCSSLPLTASNQPLITATPPAPAPAGLTITPGIYDLTGGFSYTNASPPGTTVSMLDAVTLRFNANGTYETANADGSSSNGTFATAGTNVSLTILCPAVVGPIVRPFTADTSTLKLYFASGSGTLEHIYTKRP